MDKATINFYYKVYSMPLWVSNNREATIRNILIMGARMNSINLIDFVKRIKEEYSIEK